MVPSKRPKMWVEQRKAYKRVVKRGTQGTGLCMEMGCIAGESMLQVNRAGNGRKVTIEEVFNKFHGSTWDSTTPTYAKALVDGELRQHRIVDVLYKGIKPVFKLTLQSGKTLRLTDDHEVCVAPEVFIPLVQIKQGDTVLTNGEVEIICPDCCQPRRVNKLQKSKRCRSCAGKYRFKGVDRNGSKNPNWKRGKFVDGDGYIRVTGKHGHHRAQGKSGQVYEHILVMEDALGRPITAEEHVHHKNGNKADNGISNLEVLSRKEHYRKHGLAGGHLRLHDTQPRVKFIPQTDQVVSIEPDGEAKVYDLVMEDPHRNFVANGIIVHNCGKSRVAVHALEKWMAENDVKLVLIVNILTGLHVWVEEWNQWGTYPVTFIDLHETGTAGLRKAKKLAANGYPVICIINYEMTWKIGHKWVLRKREGKEVKLLEPVDTTLYDLNWDVVILDESTSIKSPSSKVTKFILRKLKPKARYRMFLTGSAYTKRPLDVYTQLKFVLPETTTLIPPTFTLFKAKYTIPHPFIRGAVFGYQNIPDLVERMSKCCILLKKEDVLDLPPAVHLTPRVITLPPKVRKIYDEVTEELYTELEGYEAEGRTVTVNHIFAVMRKQAQITSGFIKMDATPEEEAKILELHDLKVQEVLDYLYNRGGKPTLIVTQADYEEVMLVKAIKKSFGFKPKVLNGSVVGAEARHKMVAGACEDPAFIVKEAVGAKSVDMRWADMTIWYSHLPNTINYDQMMSRNHRGGQTQKITYGHILAKGTVDMRIMKILQKDLDLAKEIEANWRLLLR